MSWEKDNQPLFSTTYCFAASTAASLFGYNIGLPWLSLRGSPFK